VVGVVITQAKLQWVAVVVALVLMEIKLYTVVLQVVCMVEVPECQVQVAAAPFVLYGVQIVHSHQPILVTYKKGKQNARKSLY
jgi:hypothetical protein